MARSFKLTAAKTRTNRLIVENGDHKRVTDKRPWTIDPGNDDEFTIVVADDRANGIQAWVIETPDSYCKGVETWPRGRGGSVKTFKRRARGSASICFTVVGWCKRTKTKYIDDPIVIVRPKRRRT